MNNSGGKMKRLGKKILIKTLFKITKRLGYNDERLKNKEVLLENLYTIFLKIGFIPKHIVDVGANHGTWTRETLKYFPNAFYTLLEPQKWLRNSIEDILEVNPKVTFNNLGAGNEQGLMKLTLAERDDSSTFRFNEHEAKENGLTQIEVKVVTLNKFIEDLALPIPDIIKIDAEGSDMEVLKGACNYFGKTEVFMVEASVVCNEIPNSISNVIKYMDENGYKLFEITDMNRTNKLKLLWLVELVFVRRKGIVDSIEFCYNDVNI